MSTSAEGSVKGKYDGRKRIPNGCSKKCSTKVCSIALRFREADALSDHNALDLVEHGSVRHIRVVAVHTPWRDDGERRLWARMARICTGEVCVRKQPAVREIKRVVHGTRRMIRRKCSALRNYGSHPRPPGPVADLKACLTEDEFDAQPSAGDRMQTARL